MVHAHDHIASGPSPREIAGRWAGALRHLVDGFSRPHRVEDDPELAKLLVGRGGRFTDSMERELMESFISARH